MYQFQFPIKHNKLKKARDKRKGENVQFIYKKTVLVMRPYHDSLNASQDDQYDEVGG